jgi:hypothetical protein
VLAREKSAAAAAAGFLREVHAAFAEAGIALVTATVDGGPEFHAGFRSTAAELGVRRDQPPARSPNLNAFVERFQGTCPHQHYRTAESVNLKWPHPDGLIWPHRLA